MNPLTFEQQQALMAPLNPNRVSNRKQGNRQLSYLEAWDVKAALIRIFGFGGFDAEVLESEVLRMDRVPKNSGGEQWEVVCKATMRLHIHALNATYTEVAISSQRGPDIGEVADFAVKTSESDALKRAAINLGTQFGLSLYDNGSRSDVVRVVFDPEQRWPRPAPEQSPQEERESLERVVDGTGATSLTPEMQAETQQFIDSALSSKRQQAGTDA